jgi:hypothetical protein
MSSIKFSPERVEAAFRNAGATDTEAALAGQRANRVATIKTSANKGVENTFSMIREQVFGPTGERTVHGRRPLDEAGLARANQIMVTALKELGATAKLNKLSATALERLGLKVAAQEYGEMVKSVVAMADWDSPVQRLAKASGLSVSTVTWEDTSRSPNSAWGDNITDMNIAVEVGNARSGKVETYEMPVIRRENFKDVTADIDMTKFMINVGNAKNGTTKRISLAQALEKPWELMADPAKWPLTGAGGKKTGVYAPGVDDQALVSSQATFLPVTAKGGRAVFKPHVYNYQSHLDKNHGPQPAVLTLMVTREGTSMAIMGKREQKRAMGWGGGSSGGAYGEPLFFNAGGKRAPLTAERGSTSRVTGRQSGDGQGDADQLNRVLIIQVPLIPAHPMPQRTFFPEAVLLSTRSGDGRPDVENAVVGHGPIEGPFDENMGRGWKRDANTPVRVTVQLTKATSNGEVTAEIIKGIKAELDAVYKNANRVGSLVVTPGKATPVVA